MDNDPLGEANRRPLAVRDVIITRCIAIWLSQKNITPNQISLMSMAFALMGIGAMLSYHFFYFNVFLLIAALCIQMRLLCNLFDGMVAVEGGKKTPAGELFNDVPDRIADPLFIVAGGFATQSVFGMSLAWSCALIAVLTAYVRVLGVSMGCPADFRGPMAKQHRMALLTFTFVFLFIHRSFELLPAVFDYSMDMALLIMLVGSIFTTWCRLASIYQFKNTQELGNEVRDGNE
ncbi:CDP-alcohol phosphatidyltransferase family protein [Photobacterium sp.]|uniref:CDP-alcohol phosphatidyltransferase family protein n=1 Tax=Photobacterium sp. TaxID=660 RepID=UPI00299EB9AF|nr:CDP-alcohol phosphatidyltransferase family protein [Photobacterium sp.]MDX1302203.1 CDP-alcohol phosphatidyltransferase family protein [Photobacterium sp.]